MNAFSSFAGIRFTATVAGLAFFGAFRVPAQNPPLPVIPKAMFNHVNISARTGMKIYHARGIKFVGSKLTVEGGKTLTTSNAEVTGLE